MINRVKGYGEARGTTGDGRVRSESWHVFWIGSERLSEMEYHLWGGCSDARARREEKRDERLSRGEVDMREGIRRGSGWGKGERVGAEENAS